MIPVIVEVAKGQNIRPSVPLSIAVVSSQIAITASPVSAAVIYMTGNVTSSVLIKEDEKKGANAASGLAAIQDLGMLSMTSNFDNEVEILRSRTLIKKVVSDMGLYNFRLSCNIIVRLYREL